MREEWNSILKKKKKKQPKPFQVEQDIFKAILMGVINSYIA